MKYYNYLKNSLYVLWLFFIGVLPIMVLVSWGSAVDKFDYYVVKILICLSIIITLPWISLKLRYKKIENTKRENKLTEKENRLIEKENRLIELTENINRCKNLLKSCPYESLGDKYELELNARHNLVAGAYTSRTFFYLDEKEYDKAIKDCSQIIEFAIETEELGIILKSVAHSLRGDCYFKKGKYANALDDYTNAVRLNPKDKHPYIERGNVYCKQAILLKNERTKLYDMAIADFNKAIEIDANYPYTYLSRSKFYRALGNKKAAQADFKIYKQLEKQWLKRSKKETEDIIKQAEDIVREAQEKDTN